MAKNKKPIICIDYDGSYNRFPDLFDTIISRAKSLDYEIIMATMRSEEEADEGLKSLSKIIKIYYTSRVAKMEFLNQLGIYPDLWIDDRPEWIFRNG